MGKAPRKPRQPADRLKQAILALAETMLDDVFSDPDMQKAFEKNIRARRGSERKLDEIAMSDGGAIVVLVQPGSAELTVHIIHHSFRADVIARYDLKTAMMTEARVVSTDGNLKTARKLTELWFEEMNDLDGDDDDASDDLLNFLLSGKLPGEITGLEVDDEFDDEPDAPPPPPSAEDAALVKAIAGRLARQMKRREPNMASVTDDMMTLEDRPQALWPILDGLIEACAASKRDPDAVEAWRFLFVSLLTLIRYRIDNGWDWASRMAEECQARLVTIGAEGRVPPEDFSVLIGAFGEARIEMTAEAKRALATAGMQSPDDTTPDDLHGAMTELLNRMADSVSDPFDICEGLGDAIRAMPGEIRSFMAHEFALSPHAVLRDTVPLLLLSEDQEVRRSAAAALDQIAMPETMSPDTLRRMIAIRNWIPETDRPALDQVIRKARLKGVVCAQWPKPAALQVLASMIDGAGANSIVVSSQGRGKGVIGGVLIKLGSGIADCWCHTDMTRAEINQMLAKMRNATDAHEVDRDYLNQVIQHAIAIGTTMGQPPGIALLRIAELAGGADWQDRRLDIAAEIKRGFEAIPQAQRSDTAIEASLKRSGRWLGQTRFTESWFLDDAATRAVLADARKRKIPNPAERLLAEVMPGKRAEWTERCLLLALRAQAAKDPAQRDLAHDFAILAQVLASDEKLENIPLMRAITEHTVLVNRPGRR